MAGAGGRAGRPDEPVAAAGAAAPSFRPDDQDDLAPSGARERFNANVAALRLWKQLSVEQRPADPHHQQVLARWGGCGATGVAQVFDETKPEHAQDRAVLRGLLTAVEYDAARRTVLNAHYTNPDVVRQVWSTLEALGFTQGAVLEPGCGAGTFIGFAPSGAELTGVELDPATAGTAALLYPQATIRAERFAETRFPAGHFDAAVGNVPFADVVLRDPR